MKYQEPKKVVTPEKAKLIAEAISIAYGRKAKPVVVEEDVTGVSVTKNSNKDLVEMNVDGVPVKVASQHFQETTKDFVATSINESKKAKKDAGDQQRLITRLKSALETADSKISSLESKVGQLTSELKTLTSKVTTIENKLNKF